MGDIQFKKITLANGETYGYRHSSGGERVIVLVHGNLASSKFFDSLVGKLQDTFTVYAMDMRGFGASSYNRPIDNLRDFAGDLKLFVDQLNLKKFDLLGWSTGGAVSMLFCSSYGYKVNRLFLVASIGPSGYGSFKEDGAKREIAEALEANDKDFYRQLWNSAIYNKKKPAPEVFEVQLEESLMQRNLTEVYYCLAKFNIANSFNGISMGTEEVSRIRIPTVIVQGKDDLLVSVDTARKLRESIGENAELVLLEDCGHSPFVDQVDELAAIIERP